ncbi:iron-containing alcohol dehydrogenase [Variovorax ginsengisoli]|uniref:Iron-containing alcohol dehydrogenase n=1 Tax=Variovorax ginsengisoli TaxID=363844 RepID=A0ABT8S7P4_9BURK|nr:iron-containing alcohol dehydrogenase [Variovorax ginsengisoli]MDN8615660.1 iron-containing alcohol dehydrogenase [Variovorax ginsengisoli]MDO1534830.1 iron-containing alcohol dehydrogenase [Variovorax ginsengisoli]
MTVMVPPGLRYRFTGHERVLHNVVASQALPELMDWFGYRRAFVVCSRTLNTRSDVIANLVAALGDRCIGLTDKVGEHSPLSNVLAAARRAADLDADVIVSVGGGSVMDMCKTMQLCISEQAFERERLLQLQMHMSADGTEMLSGTTAAQRIRHIAIPTTISTSEWTPVSTPVDDQTHLKARFVVPEGAPRGIVYDPALLARTPLSLLLSTGVRGLDHAINTACSLHPHPFASLLAEKAIQLYVENLPRLRDSNDTEAFTNCQLATWYTGMGQMSVPHGFSHWMVHIVGPLGGVAHSDAACVLMLAQARWLERHAKEQHARMLQLLNRRESFADVLEGLLMQLDMPRTLADLGLKDEQIESFIQPALDHPQVTHNNLRPIRTAADIRAVLALAGASPQGRDSLADGPRDV